MNEKIKGTICKCGMLQQYVTDPIKLFIYDADRDMIALVLNDGVSLPFAFCHFCGGNEMGPTAKGILSCQCNALSLWVKDSNNPLVYNNEFNEYRIVHLGVELYFYYCPICGGKLPESKRSELYVEPLPEEIESINQKIKGVNNIGDIVKLLGEPDEVFGPPVIDTQIGGIYGQKNIKQIVIYNSLAKTCNLLVQEYEDGKIELIISPKTKGQQLH